MDNCGCVQNEEGITTVFCRDCAFNLEQGSEEWARCRIGKLSGSRMADAIARTKSGYGASRANYRAELVCERISGFPYDGYSNGYMNRGNLIEPEAVNAYELILGVETQKVGFVYHPRIEMFGASPDRYVGTDGMLEAKARTTAIHFELLVTQRIPERDRTQVLSTMACTTKSWCDYVSFDPRAPAGMDLFVKRIYRDEARIAELESQGIEFLAEVEKQTQELKERVKSGFIFIDSEADLEEQLKGSLAMIEKPDVVVPMKRKTRGKI